jgi:ketosteroid isomerase-like protein
MAIRSRILVAAMLAAFAWPLPHTLRAETDPETAVRAALEQWRQDFNGRKSDHICDLFAPELLYDFQGLPEQNYALLCDRLNRALASETPNITYGLHIKEVIVSGDLAVVRLTWISTVTGADSASATDDEQGLDVFAKQADGSWKIIRYIAYPDIPE